MDRRISTLVTLIFALAAFAVGYSNLSTPLPLSHHSQRSLGNSAGYEGLDKDRSIERKGLLERTLDDPVALFTALLTIFTGLLFLATCGLWYMAVRQGGDTKQALSAAKDSAEAAKRSALTTEQALLGVETPYLYPVFQVIALGPNEKYSEGHRICGKIIYSLANSGRSPAILFESACWALQEKSTPDAQIYNKFYGEDFNVEFLPPGEKSRPIAITVPERMGMVVNNNGQIEKSCYLVGHARYGDVFGRQYMTSFCFTYNNVAQRVDALQSHINYRRRELTDKDFKEAEARRNAVPPGLT